MLQLDSNDCGPACLRYVLNFFGGDVSLAEIRDRCDLGDSGASLLALKATASEFGLAAKVYEAERIDVRLQELTPWIAQFRSREAGVAHFVVVREVGSRRVKFMDPAVGNVSLPHDAFVDEWTNVLARFTPEKVEPRRRRDLRWIWRRLFEGERRTFLLIALFLALLVSFFGIGSAYIAQAVVDAMVKNPFTGVFWLSLTALLVFFVIRYSVNAAVGYVVERMAARLSISSTVAIANRMPRLSWKYTSNLRHGDVVNRMKDPGEVEKFLIVQCGQIAATLLTICVGMTWVAVAYPAMLPAVAVACPLMFAIFKIFRERLVSISYQQKLAQVAMDTLLMDYARCREILISRGSSPFLLNAYTARFRDFNKLHVHRVGLLAWMGLSVALCPVLVMSWSVFWLWYSGARDASVMGHLVFQLTAIGLIFGGITSGLSAISSMDMMRVSFDRIMDLYSATTRERDSAAVSSVVDAPLCEVSMSEFSYMAGHRIQKVSFQFPIIEGGGPAVVAVTGANGAGKSSLLRAMAGVSESLGGEFAVNGRPIVGQAERATLTSYMPQTDQLFTGSMADNVFLGSKGGVTAAFQHVAESLRLPRGARTVEEMSGVRVFNGGETFSGGQRRRIALARAIQREAPLLLLDEPFANLDRGSVSEILKLLRKGPHDCVFIVTHDEEVLGSADGVLDLG